MELKCQEAELRVRFMYYRDTVWIPIPDASCSNEKMLYEDEGETYTCSFKVNAGKNIEYTMSVSGKRKTALRMLVTPAGSAKGFHVIPCCIFGDNNMEKAKAGEFPMLTYEHPEVADM